MSAFQDIVKEGERRGKEDLVDELLAVATKAERKTLESLLRKCDHENLLRRRG